MSKVTKIWGYEIIYANTDKYCGKILHFYSGNTSSLHFHIKKTESWYVQSGHFQVRIVDTTDGSSSFYELKTGDTWKNEIGVPHQIICIEEGDILEVSTPHYDTDSHRIEFGSNIC